VVRRWYLENGSMQLMTTLWRMIMHFAEDHALGPHGLGVFIP
jgi:hypothetical protein